VFFECLTCILTLELIGIIGWGSNLFFFLKPELVEEFFISGCGANAFESAVQVLHFIKVEDFDCLYKKKTEYMVVKCLKCHSAPLHIR
jgi:hypothetical protein